jgi:parallel beta-helix repeat protein
MSRFPWYAISLGVASSLLGGATPIISVPPAQARMVFVRQSGDDDNDGLSKTTALRTINKAAAVARAGDDVVVGSGTYVEGDIRPIAFGQVRFVGDRMGAFTSDEPGDVVIDATGFSAGFEFNRQLAMAVDGFVIFGAVNGIYVKTQSRQATITNNIVCNNSQTGIYIQDSRDAVVFNNLVYNNGRTGILVTANTDGSPGASVLNNTVYRNSNRGTYFAGIDFGSPNGTVLNNIVQSNGTAGLQVNVTSIDGYLSAGNVSFDNRFASGTPTDVTDIEADPLFVDPAGADGLLGGVGYADDDFRLSELRAAQDVTSPAVDAGTSLSRYMRLDRGSTRTDGRPDRGFVDAGYHYGNFRSPPRAPGRRLRHKPLYVSVESGSDTNDGATRSTALKTLKGALERARPGHRIVLLGGVYREGEITITTSGKPGRPLILQAVNGATIDAAGSQRGVTLTSVSDIVLDGLKVTGAQDNGVEVRDFLNVSRPGVPSIWLRRCHLFGNASRGLHVRHPISVLASSCIIEDNGARGIQVQEGSLRLERSIVRRNALTGLWALGRASVSVVHSDFVDNGDDGILVEDSDISIAGGSVSGSEDGGVRLRTGATGMLEDVVISGIIDVGLQAVSSLVTVLGGEIDSNRIGVQSFVDAADPFPVEVALDDTAVCDNTGLGIDAQATTLTLTNATVCSNGHGAPTVGGGDGARIRGGSFSARGASFTDNYRGGAVLTDTGATGLIEVVVARNGNNGAQVVRAGSLNVEDSSFFDNSGDGLTILDVAAPGVSNNLIYRNGSTGVLISGTVLGSGSARVMSNTFYGNGNRGLMIGGSAVAPSPNAFVARNIFRANGVAGLQVAVQSLVGYMADYNLNSDAYGFQTPPGPNDIFIDPLLVDPDAGDFHLSHRAAGQGSTSSAIDAGDVSAASVGMSSKTTRTDNVPDVGALDLGYHYPR